MNMFDKYLREDLKTDTTSKTKYNSLHIKLDLFSVHTFTFVTLLLEKACKFCRAKLPNQPKKYIGDEHGSFVVQCKLTPTPPRINYMNYQRRSISFFPSV